MDDIITELQQRGLKLTVEGTISDFLGVEIRRSPNGEFHLTQPHLIEQILQDLHLHGTNVTPKNTPAQLTPLHRHNNDEDFDGHFNYRSVIGKLNYLERCSRPDISFAVHQCARFSAQPKQAHARALKWLGRYLYGTKTEGIIYRPKAEDLHCYVDADFAGAWHPDDAQDPVTAKSRTGFYLGYAGCPIYWTSRLQTLVALSTTEAEYVALSTALREAIPLMGVINEIAERGMMAPPTTTKVHCTVFEDNSGAVELVRSPKMRPRTKHINIRYHHFREHVRAGQITVQKVSTDDQTADVLTKQLPVEVFRKHRRAICGW